MRSLFVAILLLFSAFSFGQKPLTLTSWNIEWLSVNGGKVSRTLHDFDKLAMIFDQTQADVLAFQEVDSVEAIQKLVGDNYHVLLSDRAASHNKQRQFRDINQYTGFAIRKGLPHKDKADIPLTDRRDKLRFASYLILYPDTRDELHLLAVHLKAGCSGQYRASQNCRILKTQGKALAAWIQQRQANDDNYLILGDFNHNLAYPGDWLWKTLADNNTGVKLATRHTSAKCKVRSKRNPDKTHQFRSLIDHIIVSQGINHFPASQTLYDPQEVLRYQLSDHCPVTISIY
ncbi:endonuclease/exonuclease/phosphatase family protein [Vibrio sp. CAU 1672]|uniref:endonuclease/exonuclease/phosphatase family protein n=1 Tax=Vibrio sp. CAU 1672 TaxID=3032594 RepID=UPI0023DC388E|nr:endonuclease/exonuclease/phosphatase family protein [Vibrio sp. CAU 1672]MDF2154502.1 endonuclease/exonuclease/phosphatase family protein [Vibrio sp. CAU 1672]